MAWITFSNREQTSKDLLDQFLNDSGLQVEAESYYNQNDLGLLTNNELTSKINQLKSSIKPDSNTIRESQAIKQNTNTVESSLPSDDSRMISEGDSYNCKSLRYLRSHAETAEDREWANKLYSLNLLDLWRQHVMESGETYYPPLAEDLFKFYEFTQQQGD